MPVLPDGGDQAGPSCPGGLSAPACREARRGSEGKGSVMSRLSPLPWGGGDRGWITRVLRVHACVRVCVSACVPAVNRKGFGRVVTSGPIA